MAKEPVPYGDIIGGGLNLAGMYVEAFSTPTDAGELPRQTGFGSRRDVQAIRDMEFDKKGFNVGNIGKGAASGAAIGSAVPGIGTAIGAGVGAVIGLGASLFGNSREKKAERDFNRKQRMNLLDAYSVNAHLDAQDFYKRNLSESSSSQADKYLQGLSNIV